MSYALLIIGFLILIKGAGWLVDGASSLAKKFGVPSLVIGLTIVALGTSAPELAVNILAALKGSTDLALGNILGSNIANILLILGSTALIYPVVIQRSTIWKEIPFAMFAVLILALLVNKGALLGRIDGAILLVFFLIFLYYVSTITKNGTEESTDIKSRSTSQSAWLIFFGIIALVFGGKWIVDGAIQITALFGVSESLVGLSIIAVGTSLPELATSVVAAHKKQTDIVVGNIVGSNIMNILLVLGVTSMIRPLSFSTALNLDIYIVVGATLLMFLTVFVGKKHTIQRWQGGLFLFLYIGYLSFVLFRG
jgi:cation:H+ antiporter